MAKKPSKSKATSRSKSASPSSPHDDCGTTMWAWVKKAGKYKWVKIVVCSKCKRGCKSTKPPRDGEFECEIVLTLCAPRNLKAVRSAVHSADAGANCGQNYCELRPNGTLIDNCTGKACATGFVCKCPLQDTAPNPQFPIMAMCACSGPVAARAKA